MTPTATTSTTSSSSSSPGRLHVSVVGGGIGGICATIGLVRGGAVDVNVFEAARQFAEIGAGVSFGRNSARALRELGLGDEFEAEATTIKSGEWFEWRNGTTPKSDRLGVTMSEPLGNSSVHRAKFLDAMVKHVPKHLAHFGKRLESIEKLPDGSPRKLRMHFRDGETFDTDVIIGYDGIHSKVREIILKSQGKDADVLRWSGSLAYRGLIPREKFVKAIGEEGEYYAAHPQMMLGKDTHILWFPIDHHETVNVVAFHTDRSRWPERPPWPEGEPWVQETTNEEMLSHFDEWNEMNRSILKAMDKPSFWALHQIMPALDSYVSGSVCIAGDAAHGGVPHQGAMAGQAIEDALFLSRLLSNPKVNSTNVDQALEVFDEIRRPRGNRVMDTSLEAGDYYEFASELGDDPKKLGHHLETRFGFVWDYDFAEEQRRMEEALQRRGLGRE